MYSLTKNSSLRDLAVVELPTFAVSLLVAQLFFKWGSFTLELAGFLALWYGTSAAVKWVESKVKGRPAQ